MVKPYIWGEIKNVLKKELNNSKHIMTFGTIGSLNIEHDIDLIITKNPTSKSSDFYRELHAIFDSLNDHLNKKNKAKVICFSTMLEEQTLIYLKKYNKNDLGCHIMIYFSYPQIEIDWAGAQDVDLKIILSEKYDCLFGSPKNIFSKEFMKKKHYDPTYNFLFYADKSMSNYPKKLYLDFMNKILDYLSRKRLGIERIRVKSVEDIRNCFYNLCDELDKLEQQKRV